VATRNRQRDVSRASGAPKRFGSWWRGVVFDSRPANVRGSPEQFPVQMNAAGAFVDSLAA
jgi:hypothetical protein